MIAFDENTTTLAAQFQETDTTLDTAFESVVVVETGSVSGEFTVDKTLKFENGVLSVNTAKRVEADNTLPVTSAAVHVTVGNIEALLNAI